MAEKKKPAAAKKSPAKKSPVKATSSDDLRQQASKSTTDAQPKRRLKAQPTLREQAQKTQTKPASKATRVLTSPFRFIGWLVKTIWLSRVLKPVRWFLRLITPRYFIDAYRELQMVAWPPARMVWRLTGAVLLFGFIMGLFIAGLDFVFEKLFREVLLK